VSEIVRRSSNVGVIRIAEKLGPGGLYLFQRAFGFGKKTPIRFPAQSAGLMKTPQEFVSTDMGSVPIGYTTAVTPMQMLDVFVTIANGGVSRPPRLVAATIDADGVRHEQPPARGKRVVSAQTAAEVNEMLRGVVREDGTGEKAAISGYTVAGKTGTSRKPPYEPTPRYMASFAGFAPAENPRLAALVVLDQPGTKNDQYYGGKVAAPLFASIMKYALRLEKVAPTGAVDPVAAAPGPVIPRRPAPAPPAPAPAPAVPPAVPPAPAPAPAASPLPGNVAAPVP
jgi:cell division protein FtsI (penicillin-binding protein 3)